MLVSIASKFVEEVFLFDALAITDIVGHSSPTIDLSKYAKGGVWTVRSTLNQACTIQFVIGGLGAVSESDGSNVISDKSLTFAIAISDGRIIIINDGNPRFFDGIFKIPIAVSVTATVAPTTGTITISYWGVPN